MYHILQEITCKHGKRRTVEARTLDSLGYVSGISGFPNDSGRLEQIRSKLEFTMSIGDVKGIEKDKKEQAVVKKKRETVTKEQRRLENRRKLEERLRKDMVLARQRVRIVPEDPILAEHVPRLTGKHVDAVVFIS